MSTMSLSRLALCVCLLLPSSLACVVIAGGCLDCAYLKLGRSYGSWVSPMSLSNWHDTAYRNYSLNLENFQGMGGQKTNSPLPGLSAGNSNTELLSSTTVSSYTACCQACAATTGCTNWQYYPTTDTSTHYAAALGAFSVSTTASYNCFQFDQANPQAYPQATSSQSGGSYFGGSCNPSASIQNDPHFMGKHGTRYDFNGVDGKEFCLISDEGVHVNVGLGGYEDNNNATGATIQASGKALRTWIKTLGFLWKVNGETHRATFVARAGVDDTFGAAGPFVSSASLDGNVLSMPTNAHPWVSLPGSAYIQFLSAEKFKGYDTEKYLLQLDDETMFSFNLRAAHPLLRTPTDAQMHFNLEVYAIKATPAIHGVLGQTFKENEDREKRALKFKALSRLLRGPVVADGQSGKGFLDGFTKDYVSSGILSTDCKYSVFKP